MLDTLKPAWWGASLLSSSEMHLTLLRSQKASAAGETSIGSCMKKVLMELECMSIFTSMSHVRDLPLPARGTGGMRLAAV